MFVAILPSAILLEAWYVARRCFCDDPKSSGNWAAEDKEFDRSNDREESTNGRRLLPGCPGPEVDVRRLRRMRRDIMVIAKISVTTPATMTPIIPGGRE